jgi:deoxyribodipyrimidine photo-lyase
MKLASTPQLLPIRAGADTPAIRVVAANAKPVRPDGRYVLYWMTMTRRPRANFALQRAVERARELGKPLVVFEALRVGYRWASDRLHTFVIQGMADNARAFASPGHEPVTYIPWVERAEGDGKGLLRALADDAALVVTDDFPCFMLPGMLVAAAAQVACHMEAVDSNGLLPLRAANQTFVSAYQFRRFLQKNLAPHLLELPVADPLATGSGAPLPRLADGALAALLKGPWAPVTLRELESPAPLVGSLPVDHTVGAVSLLPGGYRAAGERARTFVETKLARYAEDRNEPSVDGASGLSPYLHFGHVGVHELLGWVGDATGWHPASVASKTGKVSGQRHGWWQMPEHVESFIDELVTWRELGYNFCHLRPDYDQYGTLPDWARATLEDHAADRRPYVYTAEQLAMAATHDELWNAAQRQLVTEGRMHNYLRMLWAKKVLEWTNHPREALDILIDLNNRYGLDGRNPNSYTGIMWCLGRFDRPWGPERPIFGTIRYMSSDNTARKFDVKPYLAKYGSQPVRRRQIQIPIQSRLFA